MKILRTVLALSVSALLLAGCPSLFPKQSALEDIHDKYRAEFTQLFVSPAGENPKCSDVKQRNTATDFSGTRAAIRAYRAQFGADSVESHHLTVLDGMMHLQLGNVGLAKLLSDDIKKAKRALLSKGGTETRDYLFAEHFADLVDGWTIVCDLEAGLGKKKDSLSDYRARLEGIAESMRKKLFTDQDAGRLASIDEDQGAAYLVTTAATFDVWAFASAKYLCVAQQMCSCPAGENRCAVENLESDWKTNRKSRISFAAAEIRPAYFARARDGIARFLDATEKKVALCHSGSLPDNATVKSRRQFLTWYRYLNDNAGAGKKSLTSTECKDRSAGELGL